MRHTIFCKHYRAMAEHDTCEAGVKYSVFTGWPYERRPNCPICKNDGTLHFKRSGYNGHIHAMCATDGCVRWME